MRPGLGHFQRLRQIARAMAQGVNRFANRLQVIAPLAMIGVRMRAALPVGGGVEIIAGSHPINKHPRRLTAALSLQQNMVLSFVGAQRILPIGYRTGFAQGIPQSIQADSRAPWTQ
jgi:ethanolamine transporter EutH